NRKVLDYSDAEGRHPIVGHHFLDREWISSLAIGRLRTFDFCEHPVAEFFRTVAELGLAAAIRCYSDRSLRLDWRSMYWSADRLDPANQPKRRLIGFPSQGSEAPQQPSSDRTAAFPHATMIEYGDPHRAACR